MAGEVNHSELNFDAVRDQSPPRTSSTWTAIGCAALRARNWCYQSFDLSTDGRIMPMEGLRGLAVLLVFLVHNDALFSTLAPRESLTYHLSRFGSAIGNVGVDLFFVISGYLIYGAVLKKNDHIIHFLRRRVQRIYPTFLCVFALYFAGALTLPDAGKT